VYEQREIVNILVAKYLQQSTLYTR